MKKGREKCRYFFRFSLIFAQNLETKDNLFDKLIQLCVVSKLHINRGGKAAKLLVGYCFHLLRDRHPCEIKSSKKLHLFLTIGFSYWLHA